jgi:hypothetical protein
LTFRGPRLLKTTSTSTASTWLVGREFEATRFSRFAARDQDDTAHPTRFLWGKGKSSERGPSISCTEIDCGGNFGTILLTPLLNLWIWGVDNSLFWGAIILKVDAMHMLVTTWCTCPCGTVLMMQVCKTRLPIWWVSGCEGNHRQIRMGVASCLLTPKIPSALLVTITWL